MHLAKSSCITKANNQIDEDILAHSSLILLTPAFIAGQKEGREHCIHLPFYDLHASSYILLTFNYEEDSVTNKQFDLFLFITFYMYVYKS